MVTRCMARWIYAVCAVVVVVAPFAAASETQDLVWTSVRLLANDVGGRTGAVSAKADASGVHEHAVRRGAPSKYYIELHNFKNTMYYADIDVGTPAQTFRVMFATGSADAWLPSTSCVNEACAEHVLFNESASSSYHHLTDSFNLTYTPGMISGSVGTDTASIGGCVLERMAFGLIARSARLFQSKYRWFPFDGIIGLSFIGASVSGQLPFFDLLLQRAMVQEHVFSLYLTQSPGAPGSTLLLGGTDPKFHLDEVTFFPIEPPYIFWMVNVSMITLRESALSAVSALNRKMLVSLCDLNASEKESVSCKAVIDSGTSLISGPSEAINRLSAFLKIDPACRNLDQLPVLSFQFYGNTYPLHPEDYVMQIKVRNTVACFLGLQAYDFPEQMGAMWVLGNVFLRKYYTVFDRRNNQIGFAVARPK